MKKILLIIALLISGLGLNAQSAIIGGLKFTVTSKTPAECEVEGYTGTPVNVIIPSMVTILGEDYSVTSIRNYTFKGCSSLTSIEIPSSVTFIGNYAFDVCSSLTSIVFGDNSQLTSISYYTFGDCSSLTSIVFGDNSQLKSIGNETFYEYESLTSIDFGDNSQLNSIGEDAFGECISLTSIDFGNNSQLTSIGSYAFYGCFSLTSIEIPSSVTSIGEDAFYDCFSLTSIIVESGNMVYDSRDNCNAIIETATNTLIAGCQNTIIPNSVISIGENAFRNCSSLTSIEIPSSVTSIGENAFRDCSSLTSIIVESGNTVYDSRDNCNAIIETATNTLIAGCQNTIIPNSVTSIGKNAFSNCSFLTSIEIPNSVTSIGENAFRNCSSLTSIVFGDNSQLTSIGEYAFNWCKSLTSIEIPSSVTSIGEYAFSNCSSLKSFYCFAKSVPKSNGTTIFYGVYGIVIYVPEQSINAYLASSLWKKYTIKVMPYFVRVASNPKDAGIITGAGAYEINDTVTLIATANEGYKFINWIESGEVVSEEAKYTFVVENDRKFVANFELLTYNVTASANKENFGAVKGAGTYNHGEEVTLTAVPNEGYKFVNWTENDSVVSTEAEYSFVITGNRSLVANFVTLHEVTASVNDENFGSVTGVGIYGYGEEVTLTATPNEGYKFVNWTENGEVVSEEAKYTFVVENDRKFVANFELLTYNVTASANKENFGAVKGAGTYNHGEEVTLTAVPNEGYKFVNWTENGEVVSEEAEYTFVVENDRNLVANFEKIEQPEEPGEGVEELSSSFNIYPNPVIDKLYIETLTQTLTIKIYDVYGRLQQSMVNSQQSTVIDVANLNSGIYFVKVVTSEGEAVKRFIKK